MTVWSQLFAHGIFQLLIHVCTSGSVAPTVVREQGFLLSLPGICVYVLIRFGSSIQFNLEFCLWRQSPLCSVCLTYVVVLLYELRASSLYCRAYPLIYGITVGIICFHLLRNSNAISDALLESPTDFFSQFVNFFCVSICMCRLSSVFMFQPLLTYSVHCVLQRFVSTDLNENMCGISGFIAVILYESNMLLTSCF